VSILAQVFEPIGCRCVSVCCHIAGDAMVSLGGVSRAMGLEPDDPSMLRRLPDGGRCAETMRAFGAVLEDPTMELLLQPTILLNMRQQFDKHRPMLDVLDGSTGHGRSSETMKKDPVQVERAASVVWEWLSDEGESLLGFLQVLSIGGIPYSDMFSDNVHRCANGIKAMTMTKVEYQSIMVAWLCFGGRVVPPLEDCAPTQIDADASSSDGGSCRSMVGPVIAVGGIVESQSRGAIHVHSMAPFAGGGNTGVNFFSAFCAEEPYRQGIAGSRHAETLSMDIQSRGAVHVHSMGSDSSDSAK